MLICTAPWTMAIPFLINRQELVKTLQVTSLFWEDICKASASPCPQSLMEQGRLQGTLWGKWWKHKLGPQCTACTCSTLLSYCTPAIWALTNLTVIFEFVFLFPDPSSSHSLHLHRYFSIAVVLWLLLECPGPRNQHWHLPAASVGTTLCPQVVKGQCVFGQHGKEGGATLVSDMNCYSYHLVSVWNRNSDISRIWKCWYWFR